MVRRAWVHVVALLLLGLMLHGVPGTALAAFPERDITVVVPWAAGGGTDTLARTLAKNGRKYFGVNMNVVNRVGGVGVIAMHSVATSRPDGYTVGLITDYLSLYTLMGISELSFRDFDLVALLNRSPAGISVRTDSPFSSASGLAQRKQSTVSRSAPERGRAPRAAANWTSRGAPGPTMRAT